MRRIAFINPSLSTDNVGDLFIVDSLKRILVYDQEASIEINPREPISDADIDRINSMDCAIIAGTNLWYRSLIRPGRWTFSIEQLRQMRVPIIPWGIGTTRHAGEDNGFDLATREQLEWIHQSCRVGSVRDWRTAEALNEAGIRNITMTGCPTMLRSLSPTWKLNLKDSRKIVVTVRKGQGTNVRRLIRLARRRGLEPIVAAQQTNDLVFERFIPLLQRGVPTLFRFDLTEYERLVHESLGAIGWRLHGNMFHLAHGNPALLFANCSRSESFSNAFGLPVVPCEDGHVLKASQITEMLDRLVDPQTYAALPARYAQFRSETARFLSDNGLEHRLTGPTTAASFGDPVLWSVYGR